MFLRAGLHRRSRTTRGVIVFDRARANLLVARWWVGGEGWGEGRAWRGEGALHSLPLRMDRFHLPAHLRQPPCQRPRSAANWCAPSGSRLEDVFHAGDDVKRKKLKEKKIPSPHHHHPPASASLPPATFKTLQRLFTLL